MRRRSVTRDALFRIACAGSLSALITTLADCTSAEPPATSEIASNTTPASTWQTDRVHVPRFADQPLTIRDPRSTMTVTSRLRESMHVAHIALAGGSFSAADAIAGGGNLTLRLTSHGAEDFVRLPSPSRSSMSYELTLDAQVAGLRLVENSLELLDHDGMPRLRIERPYLVDSSNKRLPIALSLEGCAVSMSPLSPFHRPVLPAGSRSCVVRVSWNKNAATYPVVVDPAWSGTDTMSTARYEHAHFLLPNGDLLVAGGLTGDPLALEETTATAEIYSGGVWANTTSLLEPRVLGATAALPNGDLLVTGGLRQDSMGQTILGSSEIYSVTTGLWTSSGALVNARSGHTATAVGDGTILVAGGYDNSGSHFDSAELYSSGHFALAGAINTARFDHVAVALAGNRVLLGAGTNAFTGALASLELYTAGSGWAAASSLASMTTPRLLMTGTLLANGDVVFIGGYNAADLTLGTSETYHPATNTWSTARGTLVHPRYDAVSTLLRDGRVLVVGGENAAGDFRDGEIYDPTTTTFSDFCGMTDWRAYGHSATLLNDGAVLVAGGHDYLPSRILASSDLFDLTLDAGVDASFCIRPATVDGGPLRDAAPDAALDASRDGGADARTSPDATSDATTPTPEEDSSADGGSEIDAESVAFVAEGGCSLGPKDQEPRGTLFFLSALATCVVRQRRRRQKHSGRRFGPDDSR